VALVDVTDHWSKAAVSNALREMGGFYLLEFQQSLLFLQDSGDHIQTLLDCLGIIHVGPLKGSDDLEPDFAAIHLFDDEGVVGADQ